MEPDRPERSQCDDYFPDWLCRRARNPLDRSDALSSKNAHEWGTDPWALLHRQSHPDQRPLAGIWDRQHGFPNLSRASGSVAEAYFERPRGAGFLYLVALHDEQQWILR